MAATDITGLVIESPGTREFEIPERMVAYDIDFTDPLLVGVETVGLHNLVTIPKGDALVRGYGVVLATLTSGGSPTLQFRVGSDQVTGVIPIANLVIGDVFPLVIHNGTVTQSGSGYADAAAKTLDLNLAVAVVTAGIIRLYVTTIDNISS